MKKLTLLGLFLALNFIALAQTTETANPQVGGVNGNNELKLNLVYTIAGVPELIYERIIKDDMSVGLAVLVGLENNSEYSFGMMPNYRVYFGAKKANGFFIEANAAVISNRSDYYNYDHLPYTSYPPGYNPYGVLETKVNTNFGLGAAAGAKFLTRNGFVGEVFLGVGRLFGNSADDAYPRAGITIGKRF